MEFGPVQMLVVGFEHGKFEGEILAELKRLREQDIIRLVDLLFVNKDDDGEIATPTMDVIARTVVDVPVALWRWRLFRDSYQTLLRLESARRCCLVGNRHSSGYR